MQVAASLNRVFTVAPAVSSGIMLLPVCAGLWEGAARGSRRPRPRRSGSGRGARAAPPSEPETEGRVGHTCPRTWCHSICGNCSGKNLCIVPRRPSLSPSDLRSRDQLVAPAPPMGAPRLPATVPHGPRQDNERQPQDLTGALGKEVVSSHRSDRDRDGKAAREECVIWLPAARMVA